MQFKQDDPYFHLSNLPPPPKKNESRLFTTSNNNGILHTFQFQLNKDAPVHD